MSLQFTDANGREGVINDSLRVDYEGTWEAVVKEYVSDENREYQGPNAMSRLVLELPSVAPIVEVEREVA